jgi:hypothetical protein
MAIHSKFYARRSIENGRLYLPSKLELTADILSLFFITEKIVGDLHKYIIVTGPENQQKFSEALNLKPELFKVYQVSYQGKSGKMYSYRYIKTEPAIAGECGHFGRHPSVDMWDFNGYFIELWVSGTLTEIVKKSAYQRAALFDLIR